MSNLRAIALSVSVVIALSPLCGCANSNTDSAQLNTTTSVKESAESNDDKASDKDDFAMYIQDSRVSTVITDINADMENIIDALRDGDQDAADAATHAIREKRDALAEMDDVPDVALTLHQAMVDAATEYRDAADNYDTALALMLMGDSDQASQLMDSATEHLNNASSYTHDATDEAKRLNSLYDSD